jgi:hypothetical protein
VANPNNLSFWDNRLFFMHKGIASCYYIMIDAFEGEVYFQLHDDIKFFEYW